MPVPTPSPPQRPHTKAKRQQDTETSLSPQEIEKIEALLGHAPSPLEHALFSAMWSEHCAYVSTRKHLALMPKKAPHVLCGPGENAGIIDLGHNIACAFKVESHNHPSFIEPYQGAATGVGGILRDIFTMGARPVALLNALRFGMPLEERTRTLVTSVVKGISAYGNAIGVPTVGGECAFHTGYRGNNLVNVMAVGLVNPKNIFYAKTTHHAPVYYLGAHTGYDGIHGATMASTQFRRHKQKTQKTTVQIGDPFLGKMLMEACLHIMEERLILAIQDMGAAGLTSSACEMAARSGCGIDLTLENIPLRHKAMTAQDIMLSESQERMLLIADPSPDKQQKLKDIATNYRLAIAHIGTLNESQHITLHHHKRCVANIPLRALCDDAPFYNRTRKRQKPPPPFEPELHKRTKQTFEYDMLTLLTSFAASSRQAISRQFDSGVGGNTVHSPLHDAALIRLPDKKRALALTIDGNHRYSMLDAQSGACHAVAESYRNISACGAQPLAITNNLNFGDPTRPHVMAQIYDAICGIREACLALNLPVVSGNVSLYNQTDDISIPPTPVIGAVGLLDDLRYYASPAHLQDKDHILLIGEQRGHLAGSLYAFSVLNIEDGQPPPIALDKEKKHADFVRTLIGQGLTRCVHDIADGGIAIALCEMAFASDIGFHIDAPPLNGLLPQEWAFSEEASCYLVSCTQLDDVLALAKKHTIPVSVLGVAGGDRLHIDTCCSVPLSIKSLYYQWFSDYMKLCP